MITSTESALATVSAVASVARTLTLCEAFRHLRAFELAGDNPFAAGYAVSELNYLRRIIRQVPELVALLDETVAREQPALLTFDPPYALD